MRGPKDSFNEGFRQSTALIRRRIKDAKLRVEQDTMGSAHGRTMRLCIWQM